MAQATGGVGHLGGNPLKLWGFHDVAHLLWVKSHLVLPANDRISMLTKAKIAPVVTFIVKRRPLQENIENNTIRVCRLFLGVMTLPKFCLPIPLRNSMNGDIWGR